MSVEGAQRGISPVQEEALTEARFLEDLYLFMRQKGTPIERIPYLGFKQIDLFLLYKTVQSLGGYNKVMAMQQWKHVYNLLGGDPRSTSAATCTRRHYQKLILPYECHLRGLKEVDLTPPLQKKHQNHFPKENTNRRTGEKRKAQHEQMHPALLKRSYVTEPRFHNIPSDPWKYPYTGLPIESICLPVSNSPLSPYTHEQKSHYPHPDFQTSYLPRTLNGSGGPKQQLALLRTLAKEYTSSLRWEEPLNLSCKQGSPDAISQQPSSFSPPNNNTPPKFLNKVSCMYSAWNLEKEEGSKVSGNAPSQEAMLSSPTGSSWQEDSTPNASSSTRPLVLASPTRTHSSTSTRQSCSPSTLFGKATTAMKRNSSQQLERQEDRPLHVKGLLSNQPRDFASQVKSGSSMVWLPSWIKAEVGSAPQPICYIKDWWSSRDQSIVGYKNCDLQGNTEVLPMKNDSSDCRVLGQLRIRRMSGEERMDRCCSFAKDRNLTSPQAKEGQLTSHLVYNSINGQLAWATGPEDNDSIKWPHALRVPKSPGGRDTICLMASQSEGYEALKNIHTWKLKAQNLAVGPDLGKAQPVPEISSTNLLPLTQSPDTSERELTALRLSQAVAIQTSVLGPPSIIMVTPSFSPLLPLTQSRVQECMKMTGCISRFPQGPCRALLATDTALLRGNKMVTLPFS